MLGILILAACSGDKSLLATSDGSGLRCPDCPIVQVARVIDGDTFDSPSGRIRLFGVDTPERGQRCYREATERFRELAGSTVRVESGPRIQDPFGRSLWYVYTESGESIEEALIREGLGQAWTRDGQHRDYLVEVETGTRRQGAGCLW